MQQSGRPAGVVAGSGLAHLDEGHGRGHLRDRARCVSGLLPRGNACRQADKEGQHAGQDPASARVDGRPLRRRRRGRSARDDRGFGRGDLDRCRWFEHVAAPGHGADPVPALRAERLAHHPHALRQVGVLDDHATPHPLEQRGPGVQHPGLGQEHQQQLEHAVRQLGVPVRALDPAIAQVDLQVVHRQAQGVHGPGGAKRSGGGCSHVAFLPEAPEIRPGATSRRKQGRGLALWVGIQRPGVVRPVWRAWNLIPVTFQPLFENFLISRGKCQGGFGPKTSACDRTEADRA